MKNQKINQAQNHSEIVRRESFAKRTLRALFEELQVPVSRQEIAKALQGRGDSVHTSTIWRDIECFLEEGFIVSVVSSDGVRRYERATLPHHHHVQCVYCAQIKGVSFDETVMRQFEEQLKETGYRQVAHHLEFSGVCKECLKNGHKKVL